MAFPKAAGFVEFSDGAQIELRLYPQESGKWVLKFDFGGILKAAGVDTFKRVGTSFDYLNVKFGETAVTFNAALAPMLPRFTKFWSTCRRKSWPTNVPVFVND